jgi:hypothetical protein
MIAAAMDETLKHGEQQPETITQLRQQLVTAQESAKLVNDCGLQFDGSLALHKARKWLVAK